jgi:hypothetical protein
VPPSREPQPLSRRQLLGGIVGGVVMDVVAPNPWGFGHPTSRWYYREREEDRAEVYS